MGSNKSPRNRLLEITCRQEKSPDQIPGLMTTKHPEQQDARKVLAKSLQHWMAMSVTALLIVGLWVAPSVALDYPHNSLSCNGCHNIHGGLIQPDDLCLTCHNGVTATLAATHSSANTSTKYGNWAMQCTTCHEPHKQDQRVVFGAASYLVSGTSDPGGITENSLTMSGAGWAETSLTDMVLFPNLAQPSFSYKIIANTADTITVRGPMILAMTTTGNSNFAVMYGKLIRGTITTPNSGQRTVRLFRGSGTNSFADGDATYDGICEACHTQTTHHRTDGTATTQSHNDGTRCTGCHSHSNGFGGFDHTAAGVVLPVATCIECHGSTDPDLVAGVHGNQCGLCHIDLLGGGPLFEPYETTWPHGGYCTDCHGSLTTAHPNIKHTATFASGPVVIFEDNQHDDAGWTGPRPYFDVLVDCGICHSNDLPTIHGNDCATCHPTPYNTLETWNGGCQQGGCHFSYHEDSTKAHLPNSIENECSRCHDAYWNVTQSMCLNCHAANGPGDVTPPVTSTDVQAVYNGPASIGFSITDNGKVGVGRTFYKFDGGTVTAAGKRITVTAPGPHNLEFWSVDQAGNVESPTKSANFTIVADTTPPTTTSNAQATYSQGALITLTATDAGTLGVKNTYFSLNGGPAETGTTVVIPATSGTISYTLVFWSDDWSGNIEAQKSVSFTVTSGTGTLRLIWGNSEVSGSPCPGDPEANAGWVIRRGSWSGPVVASGSGGCPNWSGVSDISIPVGTTPYFVSVDWWDSYWGYDDNTTFSNVYVTSGGQVVRLNY